MTRAAVIGVGSMGKNHVRVLQEIPDVELVAVVDQNQAMGETIGKKYNTPAYTNYQEMVKQERPEAVTVAVPTQAHYAVVRDLLEMGCHVLVEKPIASTLEEGRELISISESLDRILMVGHIERFNPAIVELKRRLIAGELGRVFQIHTRRLGPFPSRIQDVGVLKDLATHDLDIMRYLTGCEAVRAYAEVKHELQLQVEDLFAGIIRFSDGTLGILEINWLTPTKIRELYVTGERGMFRVNYITQDLCFFENALMNGSNWSTLSLLRGVQEGSMTQYAFPKKEPLRAELEAFISSVQNGETHRSNCRDGLEALMLACMLEQSALSALPMERDCV